MKTKIQRIYDILQQEGRPDRSQVFLHVAEELGELSRASRDVRNGTGTEEHMIEEAVDVVITAIASYCAVADNNVELFNELFEKKCNKWAANAEKKVHSNIGDLLQTSRTTPDLENDVQYQQAVSEDVEDLVYSELGIPK